MDIPVGKLFSAFRRPFKNAPKDRIINLETLIIIYKINLLLKNKPPYGGLFHIL